MFSGKCVSLKRVVIAIRILIRKVSNKLLQSNFTLLRWIGHIVKKKAEYLSDYEGVFCFVFFDTLLIEKTVIRV